MAAVLPPPSQAASEKKRSLAFGHFRKTRMCGFLQASGHCKYGEACFFAHSQDEIQVRVSLSKTSLCKAWMKGACPLAAKDCCFAHGRRELRRVPPAEPQTECPLKEAASTGPRKEVASKEDTRSLSKLSSVSTCSSFSECKDLATMEVTRSLSNSSSAASTCSFDSEGQVTEENICDSSSECSGDDAISVAQASQPSNATSIPVVGQVLVPAFVWQGQVYMGNLEEVLLRAQPDHYED